MWLSASPPLYDGRLEYKYELEGGGVCMSVPQQFADATFRRGMKMEDMAGKYMVMDDLVNYKPVYALTSECGISMYIMYYIGFNRPYWLFVEDINDPRGTYQMWCQNSDEITRNDITKCNWMNGDEFQLSTSIDSCECKQIV